MTQDLDKVKGIIEKSGNTFHCKVLKYLQEKSWTVLISPYYNDNVSSKPREIDLIAEKAFKATDSRGEFIGTVNVKLFIECKYIPHNAINSSAIIHPFSVICATLGRYRPYFRLYIHNYTRHSPCHTA